MSEDAEMRKWMGKYFPEYVDDEELTRFLYVKNVKKQKFPVSSTHNDDLKCISDLKEGDRAKVTGTVREESIFSYIGCKECRKKVGKNQPCAHAAGTIPIEVTRFLLRDQTGLIWISAFDYDGDINFGDKVIVSGKVRSYKNQFEMTADAIDVVKHQAPTVDGGAKTA